MIKKVIGLNLNMMQEASEIINGVACDIAEKLNEGLPCDVRCSFYSFPDIIEAVKEKDVEFDDETVVVLGVPAVKNRVPLACLKLIQRMRGKGTMTIPVVTYDNNGYGNSLSELAGFIEAQGFNVVSAAAFIAKQAADNAIVRNFIVKRPDVRDFEMIRVFSTATSNKISRLEGSSVELLKVKPAPLNLYSGRKGASAVIIGALRRKEPEWFL